MAPEMALDIILFSQETLNIRFTADCRDGEVDISSQVARLVENRVDDLADRS
jgi:hypothetical protein